ncbi:MAG: hypothetical protein U5R31_15145 [Acidimicrobiia bacterium]|nr:hypothetical protein [Acidimicrobiia bacterium]
MDVDSRYVVPRDPRYHGMQSSVMGAMVIVGVPFAIWFNDFLIFEDSFPARIAFATLIGVTLGVGCVGELISTLDRRPPLTAGVDGLSPCGMRGRRRVVAWADVESIGPVGEWWKGFRIHVRGRWRPLYVAEKPREGSVEEVRGALVALAPDEHGA